MELIDEMKAHLPIPACANRELRRLLMENGLSVTPEKELIRYRPIKRKGLEAF